MAKIIRYFSTTAAGSGDGTTWADRAAFISGGAYSTILTGFDFSGSDYLECRIGTGSYTMPTDMVASIFSVNTPNINNRVVFHGCDNNGDIFIPDLYWNCAEKDLDTTGYPNFVTTASFGWQLAYGIQRCITIISSRGGNLASANTGSLWEYCKIQNIGSSTNAGTIGLGNESYVIRNCHLECSGTSYLGVVASTSSGGLYNVRIKGNINATSGDRYGLRFTFNRFQPILFGPICVIDNVADGIIISTGTGVASILNNATIVNCGNGISLNTDTSITYRNYIGNCFIANCTNGITTAGIMPVVSHNRIRVSGTPLSLPDNNLSFDNDISPGSDDIEFVNAAAGDYRISKNSIYWGKGYGAGDENIPGHKVIATAKRI